MGVAHLKRAAAVKDDEFYTLYEDIEKELVHYKDYLTGKSVYCCCDNPELSNFWKYLHEHFSEYRLKSLTCTFYSNCDRVYMKQYMGGADEDITAGVVTWLYGDGDFRSEECKHIMSINDVIITNGPFSLNKQLYRQILDLGKDFILVVANTMLAHSAEVHLVMQGKMRAGLNGLAKFERPTGDFSSVYAFWLTTFPVNNNKHIDLYTGEYDYKIYDNCNYLYGDIIEVPRLSLIPDGYKGLIGVPITIMKYWNPDNEQFEVLGTADEFLDYMTDKDGHIDNNPFIDGCILFRRIIIRLK